MDKEKIKQAIDHFENDEFSDAADLLHGEVKKARDEYLSGELDLKSMEQEEEQEEDE